MKCGTELLGLKNTQDKSETNAQTKQPLLSISELFWCPACPSQKSSLSFIGKEGRIEGMTSQVLTSTYTSGGEVTYEGELHQCLERGALL